MTLSQDSVEESSHFKTQNKTAQLIHFYTNQTTTNKKLQIYLSTQGTALIVDFMGRNR